MSGLLVAGLCAASDAVKDKASEIRPGGSGTLEVRVEGVESSKGLVYISVYLDENGYPDDYELAYARETLAAVADEPLELRLDDVPAGWLVVSVLHDADENNKLSFSFLGMPKEDYGFSNDAKGAFGPPSFDKAAIWLEAGSAGQVTIKLN